MASASPEIVLASTTSGNRRTATRMVSGAVLMPAVQLDVALDRPAQRPRVQPHGEPGDRTGRAQPVHPPLHRRRAQTRPRAPSSAKLRRASSTSRPMMSLVEPSRSIPRHPGRYGCQHVPGRLRGRAAPPGDPAPAGPGAEAAHPRQQGPTAVRRRAVGAARPGGARRVRRGAARARRHRAPVRRAAAGDRRAPRGPQVRARRDLRRPGLRPDGHRRAAQLLRRDGHRHAHRAPHRRHHQARGAATGSRSRARSPSTCSTPDDFVLEPLPNHLYTRDTSAWIGGGVSINSMRKTARMRETVHYEAVYRWHPLFAGAGFARWSDGVGDGAGHHRGRRHAGARRRRGADRDQRADHRGRAWSGWPGGCSPAARWTGSWRCGCRRPGR